MRTNGTFEYKPVGSVQTDPKTGFAIPNDKAPFLKGCECQIDKSIPAKQVVGTDGQIYAYTYDHKNRKRLLERGYKFYRI